MACDIIILLSFYGSKWVGYIGMCFVVIKIVVCIFIGYGIVITHKHDDPTISDPYKISLELLIFNFYNSIITIPVIGYR